MNSFFLTNELKAGSPTSGDAFLVAESYEVSAGKITRAPLNFAEVARQVISNLEGGYFNPKTHAVGDARYSTSGETMFGIDRLAGGSINKTPEGILFWNKIGEAQKGVLWRWNYIPPDPLQKELVDLAIKIIKPGYDSNMKNYLNDEGIQKVIESDGRLFFNFVYACWNGPGWFQIWAKKTKNAYKSGKTSSEDLLKLFVALRVTSTNSLIAQGGRKIQTLVGLK